MFSQAVISNFNYVFKSEIRDYYNVINELTVRSRFDRTTSISCFVDHSKVFGFPRYYKPIYRLANVADRVVDKRAIGRQIDFEMKNPLLEKQKPVYDKFLQTFAKGSTGFIIHAKPGWGKTYAMLAMIQKIARTAIIIVPQSNLVEQWIDRIREHTTIAKDDIGYIMGSKHNWIGKPITIALIDSLASDRLDEVFFESFGQLWCDEIHSSVPPQTYAPNALRFSAKYRGGASATPDRRDGLHKVFQYHFGETILEGVDCNRMPATVLAVKFDRSSGSIPTYLGATQQRGVIISKLAKNMKRNALIAYYAEMLYNSDRKQVIISDRTEQLEVLRDLLINKGIPEREIGYYCRQLNGRKIPDNELKSNAKYCKILLATYGLMKMGTDIKDLAGMIFATPQGDPRQSKGRIERAMEGKKDPVLVDIIDTYYKKTVDWFNNRRYVYNEENLRVKVISE